MQIEILNSAKDVINKNLKGKNIVVIDVLRATSVMVTAFKNGAQSIFPFENIDDTKQACSLNNNGLLAGERKGLKIEGFHFGNSPLDFTPEKIDGKNIFMTTSNGTRAIKNAKGYDNLYIASYLNLSAVANILLKDEKDTVILCAGTDDEFSLDDALCAGMIVNKISEQIKIQTNDATLSLQILANLSKNIKTTLENSKHYSYLKSIGYENDLEYCIQKDICNVVPFYKNGVIKYI
ncbi:2-phosphosulfolactate phosphatase [uncultured Cetobacterium sp.]|uniref:2-phosphosulfolactate phosphatase n=1 Tax=uncultured Cetobacterium sp. TaxID=527638 RepID=UPI0025FA69F4|nr:2-phosphosulfolactate phosphatase [uncultured Cetobacterium sp.]